MPVFSCRLGSAVAAGVAAALILCAAAPVLAANAPTASASAKPAPPTPCYTGMTDLASLVKPCSGRPGSTITLISKTAAGPPDIGQLGFSAGKTYSSATAVVIPLSRFAHGVATAKAPSKLCTGSSSHAWYAWLVDSHDIPEGLLGIYTMTGCH